MSQVKFLKSVILGGAAAFALSACSSSSDSAKSPVAVTPLPTMNAFQTLGAANDVVENRVSALPGSSFAAIPTVGTATFTGTGNVTMVLSETEGTNFRAIGDASVTVDFATEVMTGGLSNLTGAIGTEAEVNAAADTASLVPVTGQISLSNANIYQPAGLQSSNKFGVSYGGTLTAAGSDFVVAGRAEGGNENQFRGTLPVGTAGVRIRAIQIEDASDTFATVTDGDAVTTYSGTIGIYGENR